MKRIALAALALSLSFLGKTSDAMEVTPRDDLLNALQSLTYLYPPASPAHYDGEPRIAMPQPQAPMERPQAIVLSGQINKGDADRIIEFHQNNWTYGQVIILDSPGGNFIEALRIGTHLKELQDPTEGGDVPTFTFLVRKGDQCLSACALILAMGGGVGNALIEKGATVGFHMGILPEEQAESTAKVRDVMNLTYDIVAEYTRLIEDGWQSPLLLREALKHRSFDSFFYLRGDMRSWQLGFDPVAKVDTAPQINQVGLDEGTVMRVCGALMHASSRRLPAETQHFMASWGDVTPFLPEAALRMSDVFDELGSNHISTGFPGEQFSIVTCTVSRSGNGDISIGIYDEDMPGNYIDKPKCTSDRRVQGWCAVSNGPTYPLTVPLLGDALGCSDGTLLRTVPDDPDNWVPGWLLRPETRTGTAKRDVNIRATPGLGTSPIGTLFQGTKAEITDCALTNDKQGVFFQVRDGGTQGWVSARFLNEEGLFAFPVTN